MSHAEMTTSAVSLRWHWDFWLGAAAAKSLQSCPTLRDPIDGSPPGSPIPGILQARTLEWVAISFSNAWKWKVKVKSLSRVRPSATPWTAAHQAPAPMGFSSMSLETRKLLYSPEPCCRSSGFRQSVLRSSSVFLSSFILKRKDVSAWESQDFQISDFQS